MKKLPDLDTTDDHADAQCAPLPDVRRMTWQGCRRIVGRWIERRRQRRDLSKLDDYLLTDAGITRTEAAREIVKAFWR